MIEFEADLNPYTQLYILAVDKDSVVQTSVDLEARALQKRDLRLKKELDQE